jgi:hypothetical protein
VLTFTATGLVPLTVSLPVQEFIWLCFIYRMTPMEAIMEAFAAKRYLQGHTGIVLFEHDQKGTISSRQFLWGPPTTRPWGIRPPPCPLCNNAAPTVKERNSHSGDPQVIDVHCDKCKVKVDGGLKRPGWVQLPSSKSIRYHYILPFPAPEAWQNVTWVRKVAKNTTTVESGTKEGGGGAASSHGR